MQQQKRGGQRRTGRGSGSRPSVMCEACAQRVAMPRALVRQGGNYQPLLWHNCDLQVGEGEGVLMSSANLRGLQGFAYFKPTAAQEASLARAQEEGFDTELSHLGLSPGKARLRK